MKRYLLIGLATVGGGTVIGEAAFGILGTQHQEQRGV